MMSTQESAVESVVEANAMVDRATGHLAKTKAHREDRIRQAAAAGVPQRQLAELTGYSYQRISQIVANRPRPAKASK
jgi:hypothetical protein